ncbi:MAG: superoxide dismutase [Oscillospiraceae bacterium]|nr:superoxide dismutase [Oscillospiraceae bacterium]
MNHNQQHKVTKSMNTANSNRLKKNCMTYEFELFKLPYAFYALEPNIDALTMELHHDRHLKTYTDNLNATLKPYPELHGWTLERLLCSLHSLPLKIREAVRNNGGGVYNHIYYFSGMCPNDEANKSAHICEPEGSLARKIECVFGGFDEFKKQFKASAIQVFGSGYLWLVANRRGQLKIMETSNQDTPIAQGYCPIICLDLWEHAYYLKHYNDRASYIDDWFNVLNCDFAEKNYECCLAIDNSQTKM